MSSIDLQLGTSEKLSLIRWIRLIFFFSGFSALLYQVVWQRALFTIYGTNVQSVAMVVTAFLLGLGLGSLAGGELSRIHRWPVLLLFAIIESAIGIFGLLSLSLFRLVGSLTLSMSALAAGVTTLFLVLIPTLLMGATLPLLVEHEVRSIGNVGQSVATLYFINTLGSSAAAFIASFAMLRILGQQKTIWLASGVNLSVGLTGFVFVLAMRKRACASG